MRGGKRKDGNRSQKWNQEKLHSGEKKEHRKSEQRTEKEIRQKSSTHEKKNIDKHKCCIKKELK